MPEIATHPTGETSSSSGSGLSLTEIKALLAELTALARFQAETARSQAETAKQQAESIALLLAQAGGEAIPAFPSRLD